MTWECIPFLFLFLSFFLWLFLTRHQARMFWNMLIPILATPLCSSPHCCQMVFLKWKHNHASPSKFHRTNSRFFGVAYKSEGVGEPALFTSSLQLQLHLFSLQVSCDVVTILLRCLFFFFSFFLVSLWLYSMLSALLSSACSAFFISFTWWTPFLSCKVQFYASPPLSSLYSGP